MQNSANELIRLTKDEGNHFFYLRQIFYRDSSREEWYESTVVVDCKKLKNAGATNGIHSFAEWYYPIRSSYFPCDSHEWPNLAL